MLSNEGAIAQLFPSLEDYHRVTDDQNRAKESDDVVLESYKNETLQYMEENAYCPTTFLVLVEQEIEHTQRQLDSKDGTYPKTVQKSELVNKLITLKQKRSELHTRLAEIPDSEVSKDTIKHLLNIDRELVSAYISGTRTSIQLHQKRMKLLKPVIKLLMKGHESRMGSGLNLSVRLLSALVPRFDIIKPMPNKLRKKLLDLDIPVFNVFTERDPVFPAVRAIKQLEKTQKEVPFGSRERNYMVVGEMPHSVASPAYKAMANLMVRLLTDLKSASLEPILATPSPLRRIKA